MSKHAIFTLVPACLALACGGPLDNESALTNETDETPISGAEVPVSSPSNERAEPEPAHIANEEVLVEVEAGSETYTFLRLGEGTEAALALRVHGVAANGSVLQGLLDRDGELTLLEIFRALAPGREAPDALVQSHPGAAAAMNRSDPSVRSVEKAAVPPPGVNVCDDSLFYFAPLTWTNIGSGGALSGGDAYICVTNTDAGEAIELSSGQPSSSTCSFATTLRQMAGLCNRGTSTVTAFAGFGSATTWSTTATVTVPPGEYIRYDFEASSTPRRLAAVGLTSFGNGASYGLRSGTAL